MIGQKKFHGKGTRYKIHTRYIRTDIATSRPNRPVGWFGEKNKEGIVFICQAVCQEDEIYELDVWLVLYCSEFHWSFHLAFLTFPVPMVSFHYHISPFIVSWHFWQKPVFSKIFFSCKNSIWWPIDVSITTNQLMLIGKSFLNFLDLLAEQVFVKLLEKYFFSL